MATDQKSEAPEQTPMALLRQEIGRYLSARAKHAARKAGSRLTDATDKLLDVDEDSGAIPKVGSRVLHGESPAKAIAAEKSEDIKTGITGKVKEAVGLLRGCSFGSPGRRADERGHVRSGDTAADDTRVPGAGRQLFRQVSHVDAGLVQFRPLVPGAVGQHQRQSPVGSRVPRDRAHPVRQGPQYRGFRQQSVTKLENGDVAITKDGGDQRPPRREVPVERSDGHAGLARDRLKRSVSALRQEGVVGLGQQALVVAAGVGPRPARS